MYNSLLPALDPIISVFEKLGAGYYIGGSVASSSLGIPRTTLDIDIIADLKQEHVEPLFKSLYDDYYIDKDMIREAIERKSSFNVIHLATMMKVDIFILKNRAFDREAFRQSKEQIPADFDYLLIFSRELTKKRTLKLLTPTFEQVNEDFLDLVNRATQREKK